MENAFDVEQFVKRWLFDPTVGKIIAVLVGVLVVVALVRLIHRFVIGRYIERSDTRYHARKVTSLVGYLVAILFIAAVFGDRFTNLTVAFGIAGAGIAFALQEVIMSIAGWVAIVFSDFYKTGDRIHLSGVKGDVIDIGILRTTVMECGEWVNADQYNGRIVRLSNSFVFKEPVFNYSDDFPFLWDEIVIPVKYGSDHRQARKILQDIVDEVVGEYTAYARRSWRDIVKQYRIEDARIEPTVTMVFDENWMAFTVRYVVDYKARRATKDRLFTRILEAFAQTAGAVAVASTSTDINLTDAPVFGVRFTEKQGSDIPSEGRDR